MEKETCEHEAEKLSGEGYLAWWPPVPVIRCKKCKCLLHEAERKVTVPAWNGIT